MKLPRPLLIVVIVVLLLGVAGCGASIALSGRDRELTPEAKEIEVETGGLADLFRRLTPPSEPAVLQQPTAPCLVTATQRLQFIGGCVVSIPPTGDLRRRLVLRLATGAMSMQVTVTVDGEAHSSDAELITTGSDDPSLVLARNDSAVVTLNCFAGPCTVLVNP
ncbi:hypothetical protein BH23CHL6_BH23CHL6_01060 [soil metagenome]